MAGRPKFDNLINRDTRSQEEKWKESTESFRQGERKLPRKNIKDGIENAIVRIRKPDNTERQYDEAFGKQKLKPMKKK